MSASDADVRSRAGRFRFGWLEWFGLGLLVLLTVGLLAVGVVVGVEWRVLPPPAFTLKAGPYELSAPCPSRGIICDAGTPFYAVWVGTPQRDGSTQFREIYFMYLQRARQP